jgi:hypothetical protein
MPPQLPHEFHLYGLREPAARHRPLSGPCRKKKQPIAASAADAASAAGKSAS